MSLYLELFKYIDGTGMNWPKNAGWEDMSLRFIEGHSAWHLALRLIQQGELQAREELYAANEIDLLQWVPWWCEHSPAKSRKIFGSCHYDMIGDYS